MSTTVSTQALGLSGYDLPKAALPGAPNHHIHFNQVVPGTVDTHNPQAVAMVDKSSLAAAQAAQKAAPAPKVRPSTRPGSGIAQASIKRISNLAAKHSGGFAPSLKLTSAEGPTMPTQAGRQLAANGPTPQPSFSRRPMPRAQLRSAAPTPAPVPAAQTIALSQNRPEIQAAKVGQGLQQQGIQTAGMTPDQVIAMNQARVRSQVPGWRPHAPVYGLG